MIAKKLHEHLMNLLTVCNFDEPMGPRILPVNWFEGKDLDWTKRSEEDGDRGSN